MKKKLLLLLLGILSIAVSIPLNAYISWSPKKFNAAGINIDWQKGKISSIGISEIPTDEKGSPVDYENRNVISINKGRLDAYKRARESAVQKIINSMLSLRIDYENSLLNLIKSHRFTRNRLSQLISRRMKVSEYPVDFFQSGCIAELKMGDLIHVLPYHYPSSDFPKIHNIEIETRYTGLIVDTRGLGIMPMVLPSIYNEDGLEIYSRYNVDIKWASKYGIVSYVHTESMALKNRKAGNRPFYTVAVKESRGCPVLSTKDIRKIYSSRDTLKRLKKCNVIFIIDREKKINK
ncbi:hypothetical protein ACFL20_00065 [Spirochaetota bacterium]